MFIGRKSEKAILEQLYQERTGRLVVIYGRRRIGKSELIHSFLQNKKHLYVEGLEGEHTPAQIRSFIQTIAHQTKKAFLLQTKFTEWNSVFNYLTENLFTENEKYILAIDEFQWLAAGQIKLVNQIKSFWDTHWKRRGVLLILCGSVAHYMVKKVIRSKSLYGRIDQEIHLSPMPPADISQLLSKRSHEEVLRYLLIFGGVPKYFDILQKNISFDKNINKLCFTKDGFFVHEVEKIFYSQFREHLIYKKIVIALTKENLSLEQIAKKLRYPSGGSLKSYLENLELAGFIRKYGDLFIKSRKTHKYKLVDPFLRFYFSQMLPQLNLIEVNLERDLYGQLIKPFIQSWMGYAFENFCINSPMLIAKLLKIENSITNFGPYYSKERGVQFDLIFIRNDKTISLCEIKYTDHPIKSKVIGEFAEKLQKFKQPPGFSIEKVLISAHGCDTSVYEAEYFDQIITGDHFF